MTFLAAEAFAEEKIILAGYKDGFYIRSEDEGVMELRLGGSFWVDYRGYIEDERTDNRYDIRRSRIYLKGMIHSWIRYNLEYEFQSTDNSHLKDGYAELAFKEPLNLRIGQFKEPFSLEWQTPDKAIMFAERSMGNVLTPGRDVGAMLSGNIMNQSVQYGIGLFNGNGPSGSARGTDHDSPEITGRMILKPFQNSGPSLLRDLQGGFSASYATINSTNISVNAKTTGMANMTTRSIYDFGTNSYKFGILQDVDTRIRGNVEAAWVNGPFAATAEYFHLKYNDISTAERSGIDADFSAWYAALGYCVTGEEFFLMNGMMTPISPKKPYSPDADSYGALILALRYDHFKGDTDWIVEDDYVSVRHADAVSACATWFLYPMFRILADFTYTDLSDPIKVKIHPNGNIDFIHRENVLTLRLGMDL